MAIGDASRCPVCHKTVGKNAAALQCDLCDLWLHAKCIGISMDLYTPLSKCTSRHLKVYCTTCEVKIELLKQPAPSDSEDDEPLNTTCLHIPAASTSTPISSPKKTFAEIVSLPSTPPTLTVDDNQEDSFGEVLQPPIETSDAVELARRNTKDKIVRKKRNTLKNKLEEVAERMAKIEKILENRPHSRNADSPNVRRYPPRERCLIIVNAKESLSDSSAERMQHDQDILQLLVSMLFDDGEQGINIVSAFRLGKRKEDPVSSPRPLKVVLDSDTEVGRVLKRLYRIKETPFRVFRDLSPEDRLKMKEAVKELKDRKDQGETDLKIVDFRVVKKKPRVGWKPILLLPLAPQTLEC
jgi:hypothetical protein